MQRTGVLTDDECKKLIRSGKKLVRASVTGLEGSREVMESVRRCQSKKIPWNELDPFLAAKLFVVVHEITGAPLDRLEPLELIRYERGGFYNGHYDWLDPVAHVKEYERGGQRTHSLLLYLCDVRRGGETTFPKLGTVITPQAGKLVAWNNTHAGVVQDEAFHVAKAVESGHKWLLATWVRERTYV